MTDKNLISAGKIVGAHGIRGGLKVFSHLENPKNFENYQEFYIDGKQVKLELNFVKGNVAVIDIEGLRKRELAEELIGKEIFIDKTALPQLAEGEFYYADIIGLKVVEAGTGIEIGTVAAMEDYGAGDILEIKFKNPEKKNKLVAFTKSSFPKVDVAKGVVEANLPEEEFDN